MKWVIYFPWNVICPPAVRRDSWRNAHKKHTLLLHSYCISRHLEGLGFQNFPGGSMPSDPPSLGMLSYSRKPPNFGTRSAVPFDAAPNLQYLKVKFSFESWIFVIYSLSLLHLLNGLKMQEMAVLGGLDFKISRGSMPPDPPSNSRLPALGPLFLNFLDPSLIWSVFPRGHLTIFTNIPIPHDETLTKAWQTLNCGKLYDQKSPMFRETWNAIFIGRETDDFFFVKRDRYPPFTTLLLV